MAREDDIDDIAVWFNRKTVTPDDVERLINAIIRPRNKLRELINHPDPVVSATARAGLDEEPRPVRGDGVTEPPPR